MICTSAAKNLNILFCFFCLMAGTCFSQNLTFSGNTIFEEEALADAKIRVMQGTKVYAETFSDVKGQFSLKLDFNLDYTIHFEKENYSPMFATIRGAVPEDRTHYKTTYKITVPFYHVRDQTLNLKAFQKPFTKITFDGKSKFVDDPEYLKEFMITLQTLPEHKAVVAAPKIIEKRVRIAGKVLHPDTARTPYRLVKVNLVDTASEIVGTTLTNKYGVFSFPAAGLHSTYELQVVTIDAAEGAKAEICTLTKEAVASPGKTTGGTAHYLNSPQTKLIERLVNETYTPFLAGKLTVEEKGENAVLSGKNVYLVSDKNEVLETTKTNVFGSFLFSKLSAGKNFTIGVDEKDAGLSADRRLHLYSAKDIEILKKDTLLGGKHLYKFLSNDVNSYNELLVEDSGIRMDLKGKLAGDNENNPLKNIRIVLLDNSYKVIDSVRTDKDGKFSFRYLPYSNDVILQVKDTADLVNYTSIILYDGQGNVVKYFSVRNSRQFNYKLLRNDLNLIDELYVDDPWLSLADKGMKKAGSNKLLIIENIYFESNKAELLQAARQTLDKAILAMKSNSAMKMEISAHSDSKGSDDYNLKLSEQRAQSALEYIASKGVDRTRITAKGYGETKLLNKCGNKTECPEEAHAKNRRLEFNISMN